MLRNGSRDELIIASVGSIADLLPPPGPPSTGRCTDPREERNIPRDNHQPIPGHVIQFFPRA